MSNLQSSPSLIQFLARPRFTDPFRSFNFLPTTLALLTSLTILCYISLTSNFFHHHLHHHHQISIIPNKLQLGYLRIPSFSPKISSFTVPIASTSHLNTTHLPQSVSDGKVGVDRWISVIPGRINQMGNGINSEVFHNKKIFLEDYKEMNQSFKIYVYPHRSDDPFANVLLPVDFEPGGNYASESYFKKVLMESHFITKNPAEADLFFLPFSIARLRHDSRVGVSGILDFIRDYIFNISRNYPYWNRTNGADHFYVACHSAGRTAMEKASEAKFNAIQVVCSSSYYLSGYVAHKDASLPQIWPRKGNPPNVASLKRKRLAFFAGAVNSPVREKLIQEWRNDSEIYAHFGRLTTPYSDALLGSKFCLHVKGFEVNTARIGDAMFYGCVPIIIANHYDLPFADILNWKSFSLVVATLDIPLLKEILHRVSSNEYETLQRNVLKVRKHFRWHLSPVDYDAFYMVMYELWLRRGVVRIPISGSPDTDDTLAGDRNIS